MTSSTAPRTRIRARPFVRIIIAPGSAEEMAIFRSEFSVWLGPHPRKDDAVKLSVELAENALVHGSGPGGRVTLEVERLDEDWLSICVSDAGRTASDAPPIATPGFGHGLRIVEDRCEQLHTIVRRNAGRTVRAVLAPTPPPIIEPDVDLEALLAAYPDGEPDSAPDGGNDAS